VGRLVHGVNAFAHDPPRPEYQKPHTMAPGQMAQFLLLLDQALGRATFAPPAVWKAILQFKGWGGDKPHVRWKGLLFWHCQSCEQQHCHGSMSLKENIHRCGTLRVLLHQATVGLQPSLWLRRPVEPTEGVGTPYKLSPMEKEQALKRHTEFVKHGVFRAVPKREWARRKAAGQALSSAFMVVNYKAKRSAEGQAAREGWLRAAPGQVEAFIAGDKRVVPPAEGFTPKWRVVYDLKALNAATFRLPMAYGRQDEAFAKVEEGDTLAVLDVKDGFTAVPVSPHDACPFAVVTDGQGVLEAQRMPFGYKLAPFFFCLVSGAIARAVQVALGDSGATHMYMDDLLLILRAARGPVEGTVAHVLQMVTKILADCGAAVSEEKIEGPAQRVTYLGLDVDCAGPGVQACMPSSKWFTLRETFRYVDALVAAGDSPVLAKGAFESMVGKIAALATFLPLSKPDIAVLYRVRRQLGRRWKDLRKRTRVKLGPEAVQALTRLQAAILEYPHRQLGEGPWGLSTPELFGAVDASGEGGLGGHLRAVGTTQADCWSERVAGAVAGDEWVGLSTLLEVRAIRLAIVKAISMLPAGQDTRLTLCSDSQAAVGLVRKGYSTRCAATNDTCREIEELLRKGRLQMRVCWIPRQTNWRADALSHPGRAAASWQRNLPQSLAELTAEAAPGPGTTSAQS